MTNKNHSQVMLMIFKNNDNWNFIHKNYVLIIMTLSNT